MRAFAKGAPVRILLPAFTGTGDLYWYVKADSPIKTAKDITDKHTIAYSTSGSSSNNLVLAFNQHFAHLDLLAEIEKGRVEELEEEFRRGQFEQMAQGLTVEIDGKPAGGRFRAADTPINGRATEGFFVYVLEYAFERPPRLPRRLEIAVTNRLYQGVDMVFANHVEARGGWRVVSASTPQPPPGADLTVGSPEEAAMWDHPFARPNDHRPGGDFANYRTAGLADMAQAILEGREARCSLDRALHGIDVMTSILRSGETGAFVELTTTCTRPEPLGPEAARALLV